MEVKWTRTELVAVREAIEVTPLFDGRPVVRETVRRALRANRWHVSLDVDLGARLAAHLVPADMQTAMAKVKLLRAIRDARLREAMAVRAARIAEAA
jgi:hypothetical protein